MLHYFLQSCFSWTNKSKKENPTTVYEFKEIIIPTKLAVFDYISPQEFSLPKTIINYLLKNIEIKMIKKLQQSCRYFYSKFNYNIIDYLMIANHFKIECQNYELKINDSLTDLLKNDIYLNEKLYIWGSCPDKIFTKIIKCDIYKLSIYCCKNFSINDFAFLAKSGTLKIVTLFNYIYYDDGTKAPLEDVLSYIPNVYSFCQDPCILTSNTMKNLLSLKRNVKFSSLHLRFDNEFPDAQQFFQFIKQMFDFDLPPNTPRERLSLMGRENDMRQLYELFKTIRDKCSLEPHDGDIKLLAVY